MLLSWRCYPAQLFPKARSSDTEANLTILIAVAADLKAHQRLNTASQALLTEISAPRSGLIHQQKGAKH
ncbi:hypothetical protein EMM73_05845 [Rheinheimera sediminis]|uniref:hypothetical protein n=1 Tax=Rheinheimera sp. YQF-1 TaxID=2499626 RepID=UPI000FDC7374|nr:hypothetical protein [Rheinheimera sp. YQF-1]RVT47078.1 hypothetical protein EMM73_05845 [Rheinheimera sp. YQF-1]